MDKYQLYYLSFLDPKRATGTKFLGATVVRALSPRDAMKVAWRLKLNPGGEVAMVALPVETKDELPPAAQHYFEKFVPREQVISEGGKSLSELKFDRVCSECNEE